MTGFFAYPEPHPTGVRANEREHSPFLHDCDRRSWAALRRHSHIEGIAAGRPVIRRGDTERSLVVLLDGELVVPGRRDRWEPARYEPGEVLGELTFFDGRPQPETVVAARDSHVLRIRQENFDVLAAHEPALARQLLMDLGRAMATRLRAAGRQRS